MKKLETLSRRLLAPGRHALPCLVMVVLTVANARAQDLEKVQAGIQDRVNKFSTVDVTWSVISHVEAARNQAVNVRDPFGAGPLSKLVARRLRAYRELLDVGQLSVSIRIAVGIVEMGKN
jgi:hypothetical protein